MIPIEENRIITKNTGNNVLKSTPSISVIIPSYNSAGFIAETLQTAFSQTFRDYEVIVINDGSPDTAELERTLKPFFEKIIYIEQENRGAGAARNTGISIARGKFLAFLDSDDLWFPEYLESQMKFLSQTEYQMIYCDALIFNETYWSNKTYMDGAPSKGAVTTENLILGKCNVITSGTIVEKETVLSRKGFDENSLIAGFEDFDLWFGLLKNGCGIGYQKKVLLKYRVTVTGLSGGNIKRAERSVCGMEYIKEKNDFSETESLAWDRRINYLLARLEIEKGKYHLVKKDFKKAAQHLAEANGYFHERKLQWLIKCLHLTPKLVFNAYKSLRAEEFNFVSSSVQIKD